MPSWAPLLGVLLGGRRGQDQNHPPGPSARTNDESVDNEMSSLWTPDGERPVNRNPDADSVADQSSGAPGATPTSDEIAEPLRAAAAALGLDIDSMSDEDRQALSAELEEMMRVRREVAATPAAEMIANHMIRFLDLATIYLEGEPPAFAEAATCIEAYRAVLEGLGDRLGEHRPTLTEALGQVQRIFIQVKEASENRAPDA